MIKTYLAGAKPREKRIEELEKSCDETQELLDKQIEVTCKLYQENAELIQENEEMKKGLGCETCQIHLEYMRLNNKIADLEKENAELKEKLEGAEKARDYWKDSSFDWRHKCTSRKSFKVAVKAQKQLTKAKELIEDMYDKIPASHSDYYKDVMERAKQFLSEVEK
jgi:cell division septum initiation protein DivIVA